MCRDGFGWLFSKQPLLKEAWQFTGSFSSPAKQFSEHFPGEKKKTNRSSAGSGAFFITNSNHGYSRCCGQTPRCPLFNLVFPFTSQVINRVLKRPHLERTSILTPFLSVDES